MPMKSKRKKSDAGRAVCTNAESKISTSGFGKSDMERLAKSGKLEDFVRRNNGSWDHQKWLTLCEEISLEGYEPIDYDQVGILIEQYKTVYFSN